MNKYIGIYPFCLRLNDCLLRDDKAHKKEYTQQYRMHCLCVYVTAIPYHTIPYSVHSFVCIYVGVNLRALAFACIVMKQVYAKRRAHRLL